MSDANANGATTVAMYAATGHPDLSQYDSSDLDYQDWVPDGLKSDTWDVSFDRHGRCGWTRNYFDYGGHKSHAIEVVTRQAPLAYLAFLQSMKIPYIVCGDQDIDLEQALVKLKRYFGIATLAVCGGRDHQRGLPQGGASWPDFPGNGTVLQWWPKKETGIQYLWPVCWPAV